MEEGLISLLFFFFALSEFSFLSHNQDRDDNADHNEYGNDDQRDCAAVDGIQNLKGIFGHVAELVRQHDAVLPDLGQFVAERIFDFLAVLIPPFSTPVRVAAGAVASTVTVKM